MLICRLFSVCCLRKRNLLRKWWVVRTICPRWTHHPLFVLSSPLNGHPYCSISKIAFEKAWNLLSGMAMVIRQKSNRHPGTIFYLVRPVSATGLGQAFVSLWGRGLILETSWAAEPTDRSGALSRCTVLLSMSRSTVPLGLTGMFTMRSLSNQIGMSLSRTILSGTRCCAGDWRDRRFLSLLSRIALDSLQRWILWCIPIRMGKGLHKIWVVASSSSKRYLQMGAGCTFEALSSCLGVISCMRPSHWAFVVRILLFG